MRGNTTLSPRPGKSPLAQALAAAFALTATTAAFAQSNDCPAPVDGTITVNGLVTTGEWGPPGCQINAGTSVVVNQTGDIWAYGGGITTTGEAPGGTDPGSIENHGRIGSSNTYGIEINHTYGDIINHEDGTISARYYGVYVTPGGHVETLENRGTIEATETAWGGAGRGLVLISGGHIGTIDNYGTISGTDVGIFAYGGTIGTLNNHEGGQITGSNHAIYMMGANTINNWGDITGHVRLADSVLYLRGTSGSLTGNVTGSADSSVVIQGSYASRGTFDVGAIGISHGAEFTLSDTATVANGLLNQGTLIMEAGHTTQLHGDYEQLESMPGQAGGTFRTQVAGDDDYGKFVVNGDAWLTSNRIFVDVIGSPELTVGGTLEDILRATGTLYAGSEFEVSDNSALFDFLAFQDGNSVHLMVQTAASSGGLSVEDSVRAARNRAGLGAARRLDQLIAQGGSGPAGMAPVITALGTLPDGDTVSGAVSQMLPLLAGAATRASLSTRGAANRALQQRQRGMTGLSSGSPVGTDRNLWVQPLGSWARQSSHRGVAGHDADTYGIILGADAQVSDRGRFGAAFSYTHSDIDWKNSDAKQRVRVDTLRLIGYGSVELDERTQLNLQADVATHGNRGRRTIDFGGLREQAKSRYDSVSVSVGAGLERRYELNERTTVLPEARIDYTWIRDERYREKGADALNLSVRSNKAEELVASLTGHVEHKATEHARIDANLGIGYDLLARRDAVTAAFAGGGAQFTIKGIKPSPWLVRGGASVVTTSHPSLELTAGYAFEARKRFANHTAYVKLNMPF